MVWPVTLEGTSDGSYRGPGKLAILKATWAHTARTCAAEILISLSNIAELPRLLSSENGPYSNDLDLLGHKPDQLQALKLGKRYDFVHVMLSRSSIDVKSKNEAKESFVYVEVDEVEPDPSAEIHHRQLRWTVEEYCGIPINTSPEPSWHLHIA